MKKNSQSRPNAAEALTGLPSGSTKIDYIGAVIAPKYVPPLFLESRFGVSVHKLAQYRYRHKGGPPFVRVGYRTILYEVAAFERWLNSLPHGGQRV